jgi:hypothetical protein
LVYNISERSCQAYADADEDELWIAGREMGRKMVGSVLGRERADSSK